MLPAIFGLSGQQVTPEERDFFRRVQPFGYILFRRNIETPEQVKKLVDELKEIAGRDNVPVLIDQEGGRVQRLRPPHWPDLPDARMLGSLYEKNPAQGLHATGTQAEIIAGMLLELGMNAVCAPVLDLPVADAHDVIGNRAFSEKMDTVVTLGAYLAETLLNYGVTPILKHIPGHGRAMSDSHYECPVVNATRAELLDADFKIFKDAAQKISADAVWAMTAHVVFPVLDEAPVSVSKKAISFLRDELDISGPIIPDAIEMEALGGTIAERALATINAGCDATLHCSGNLEDMIAIAEILPPMSDTALQRFAIAEEKRSAAVKTANWRTAYDSMKLMLDIKTADAYQPHEALTSA